MNRNKTTKRIPAFLCIVLLVSLLTGCQTSRDQAHGIPDTFSYQDCSFERNGITLHLDCVAREGKDPEKQILLVHGVTYSSHEFDIDYADYSLVRCLAREGYAVWRLDIAGYGRSGKVDDGYMPDSDYAAEDIGAAVERIVLLSGEDKIDLLGWSWGTVTAGRYAAKHPQHINKLVLYAPVLSGIGEYDVNEAFHHNTWEHAADDFQRDGNGDYDYSITEPVMIDLFCSSCWHYDGEYSPNGGRRDLCVDRSETLIDLAALSVPTLIICGDKDPYLNYDRIHAAADQLPEGSATEIIPGGAHMIMYEKPYYHEFQSRLTAFLQQK